MESIMEIRGITKSFPGTVALNNINLTLPKGKIIGLLGPNGSGKTTLIKLAAGLLVPTAGELRIGGYAPGIETKGLVSYLPERPYFSQWMNAEQMLDYFENFYSDFDRAKAMDMMTKLNINPKAKMKTLSKGTKEKVQLILVMSRHAKLYLLDEPIGGVDPATRDYILETIISNYASDSTVIISTHLIYDIEKALDEFIFINNGNIVMYDSVDAAREKNGKTIDELFREVFRC
ncbi:MAG: ABC transporter ATP-binding protein [Clostridia bacterium]